MIIQCDKCSTKFKVDDSKIPAKGAKIRCKKCQHIFKVERTQPDTVEAQPKENLAFTEKEKTLEEGQEVPRPSEMEHMDFWGTEPPLKEPEEEDTFEEKTGVEEWPDIEKGESSLTGFEEDFVSQEFGKETTREEGRSKDSFQDEFIAKEKTGHQPALVKGKRKLPLRNVVILALFLLVVVGGGVYLLQIISGKRGTGVEEGAIGISGLKGYYHNNKLEKRLFVIEGRLVNPWNFSISSVTVKGSIFDHNRNELQKRIVVPGKILNKKQLTELSIEAIEANLNLNKTPPGNIIEIKGGNTLPFMIVFSSVPSDLSEFLVEVSG